jgi:hypothetical protein
MKLKLKLKMKLKRLDFIENWYANVYLSIRSRVGLKLVHFLFQI